MIVDIHAHIGHHPLMDFKQTPEEILRDMEKYGIDVTFVMPFPSMKIQEVNDRIAAVVKEHPDRLIGFGCVDPNADGALEEVERIVSLGLKGVMLDPEFHRVFGRSPKIEFMVPCMDNNLPVLFNNPNSETGESESMGRETYYNGLNQLAYKFPEVRLVVNTFWPRIKELMRTHRNIIIDTGGRNGITSGVGLVKDLGPTRICFGSESPQNHPGLGVKEIRTLKLAPVYRELLLGKNAKRIFRDLF
ncbi:MAG: amidohydrolase family protein [Candidatus Bathyarchaeota archaeon]|nr:amidohydrolase family protein [Candidatus Bathyarchaeota archaeon]